MTVRPDELAAAASGLAGIGSAMNNQKVALAAS